MIALTLLGCAPPSPGRPNILLVSFDTVRADHLSVYGSPRDTTPNLARLAASGVVFDRAFSQGNESAYSHAAIFTGRYASEVASPVYETYAVPPDALLVPEVLKLSGYHTAAFVAGGHVTDGFGFDQGYDHFESEVGFASFFDTGPKALKWMAAQDGSAPWFLFLHSYDAHRPYTKPGPWSHLYSGGPGSPLAEQIVSVPSLSELVVDGRYFPGVRPAFFQHPSGELILSPSTYDAVRAQMKDTDGVEVTAADHQHVQDHYDASLAYADLLLGAFLADAEAAGRLENTVVVVLSDHGEDLLDHGYMNHRTGLYDSCTHVPLIVSGPGFPAGKRVDGLVDALDLAPTLLALAGAVPPAGLRGRDLRDVVAGTAPTRDAVFSEGVMDMIAVRTATHRLVYHHAPLADPGYADTLAAAPLDATHFTLYDLAADPGETTDRVADPALAGVVHDLRDRLVAWRRGLAQGTHVLPQDQVPKAMADQLREHGYWEASPTPPATATPAPPPPASPP
jgi:arylsulfatase A-like enzyme